MVVAKPSNLVDWDFNVLSRTGECEKATEKMYENMSSVKCKCFECNNTYATSTSIKLLFIFKA